MAILKVYNGSSWVTCVGKVWDGSAWVAKMAYHDGTSFVELYDTGPQISIATDGDTNVRVTGTCYCGIRFNSNGIEYEFLAGGQATSLGNWLDSGLNSEVWVEMTLDSGSWNDTDSGTARLQLSTTRSWTVSRSTVGSHSATATFKFYDAASGGNLLYSTGSIVFTAQRDP